MSYESQSKNVVIVPVDGEFNYTASALQKYLNKVYAPAIVSWTVDVAEERLKTEYDEGEANGLNTSRTFFSSFNEEMKKVIKAMESRGDYKPDKATYYLFVMNKAENESLNGLMPFNSKYGFLFTGVGPDQTQLFRTIAHELGHGAFKLRHNFDQFSAIEKRSTLNLMDYTITPETATILRKFQWDEIISPRLVALGWSEEKYAEGNENYTLFEPMLFDEASSSSEPGYFLLTDYRAKLISIEEIPNTEGLTSFISPTGDIITLPAEAFDFTFNQVGEGKGSLYAFSLGKYRYISCHFTKNHNVFAGYLRKTTDWNDNVYKDIYSKVLGAKTKVYHAYKASKNTCEIELHIADYSINISEQEEYIYGAKKEFVTSNASLFKNTVSGTNKLYEDKESFPTNYICPPPPKLNIEKYQLSDTKMVEVRLNWEASGNTLYIIREQVGVFYVVHRNTNDGDQYLQWDQIQGWVDANFKEHIPYLDGIGYALLMSIISPDNLHYVLDGIGFIPVIGEAGDLIHGIWYVFEGDKTNAMISFVAIIPVVGDFGKAGKYIAKGAKYLKLTEAGKYIIKSADEIPALAKIGDFAATAFKNGNLAKAVISEAVNQMTGWVAKHGANAQFFVQKLIATHNTEMAIALTKTISTLPAGKIKLFFVKVALTKIDKVDNALLLCNNIEKLTPELIKVWTDLIDAYPNFANNIDNLINLNKILESKKLTDCGLAVTDIWTIVKDMRNANLAAPELGEFLTGMNKLIEQGTKFENIGPALADLAKDGTNFPQGFGWTLTYLTKNSDEFAGKTIKFENRIKTVNGAREIDLTLTIGKENFFYEFKSVVDIPPQHFAEQFLKDLSNKDVTDLSQLKWLFDGRKLKKIDVDTKFKEPIMNAIEKMLENGEIADDLAKKLLADSRKTATNLIDEIDKIFDSIFKIK